MNSVLLLEGARQVGKSTFINQVLKNREAVISLNLEEKQEIRHEIDQTKNFEEFEQVLRLYGFDRQKKQILFIDEAQESDQLGSYVRFMKEKWPKTCCLLTGSSMTRLFKSHQRVPVGRTLTLQLMPFSFSEFLQSSQQDVLIEQIQWPQKSFTNISEAMHQKLLNEVDNYLKTGGLPEVVTLFRESEDYKAHLKSILLSQQEDFIRKSRFENRDDFMEVLKTTANHLGSAAKYTQMSGQPREMKKVVNVMKNWHLIHEIEQKGIAATTQFYPKRYCYDLGIAQMVRSMPFPALSLLRTIDSALRTQLGGLFENMVLLQLLEYKLGQNEISGWKENSKNNVEVDFILNNNQPMPIECKAAQKISPRSFSGLKRYLDKSGVPVGFLVSSAPFMKYEIENKTFFNLPLYLCRSEIIQKLCKIY